MQPGGVDDDVPDAGAGERLDVPLDQRFAAHLQQRFGRVVGQRPHALAAPGREDHGSHRFTRKISR